MVPSCWCDHGARIVQTPLNEKDDEEKPFITALDLGKLFEFVICLVCNGRGGDPTRETLHAPSGMCRRCGGSGRVWKEDE